MPNVRTLSFLSQLTLQDGKSPYKGTRRPLMVASSGGGGHISAIKGLYDYLKDNFQNVVFDDYTPKAAPTRDNPYAKAVRMGSKFTNQEGPFRYLTTGIVQPILRSTSIPILPTLTDIYDEVKRLESATKRPYLDLLLDVYPTGYEYAAIWNILQKKGEIDDLKKMIAYQPNTDEENGKHTKQYFTKLLENAVKSGHPYSEIISTQVLSIPALCEVVYNYNIKYQDTPNIPKLFIHQYFTDLPTKGACHFFNAINKIQTEHKSQIMLYGVGFTETVIQSELKEADRFQGIFDIPPHDNPMVRPGFKDPQTSLHNAFDDKCTIAYKAYQYENGHATYLDRLDEMTITAKDKVASITLSSQASTDTLKYIDHLLSDDFNKIFVFGGYAENIYPHIDEIVERHALKRFNDNQAFLKNIHDINDWPDDYIAIRQQNLDEIKKRIKEKIILLGNQDDRQMQPILTRSNVIIKRGGGLSVMEEIAVEHHPQQCVLIHHPDCASIMDEPKSGIPWEDENATALIKALTQKGIFAKKTMPARFLTDYNDARLYHTFMSYIGDIKTKDKMVIEKVALLNLSIFHQFICQLNEDDRPNFARAILNNNQLLHALNRMSIHSKLPLSRDIIFEMMAHSELVELASKGEYTPALVLHLLSYQTSSPIKFKSANSFLSLLSVLYEPKHSYYKIDKLLTNKDIKAIKDNIFKTILSQSELHTVIFSYLKRSREINHVLGHVMKDLLIYQSNHLDDIYEKTTPPLSPSEPKAQAIAPPSTEEKLLIGLDYLIAHSYFKTGLFSSGFFEGWFGLGGSTVSYKNKQGETKVNIVPRHMMYIHQEIQRASDPNDNTTYAEALSRVKTILNKKTKSRHARKEYEVFKAALEQKDVVSEVTINDPDAQDQSKIKVNTLPQI